nr:helix-turn-helix transcriptional regulator [Vibrio penaeicida]
MMTPTRQDVSINQVIKVRQHSVALFKRISMEKGYVDSWHGHDWHQVIFPLKGLLQTQTKHARFLVPHTSILFVPAGVEHESVALSDTRFIGIYLNPAQLNPEHSESDIRCPTEVQAVSLSPFLRHLLLEIERFCEKPESDGILRNLIAVLNDQFALGEPFQFKTMLPRDRRLKTIFERLSEAPAQNQTLAEWGEEVGASERTLSRLFASEFSMSFALWRQHIRMVHSLALLDSDLPIQAVASQIGYENDSSYIKTFKGMFGITPNQYKKRVLDEDPLFAE